MKSINPFKFTGPLDPEQDQLISIMRSGELKEVARDLCNQTYYALVGPRQIGKTTFLFQLMHEIKKNAPGFLPLYVTLEDLVQVKQQEFYKNFARKLFTTLSCYYRVLPVSLKERYKTVTSNLDLKDFLLEMAMAQLSPTGTGECIEFEAKEHREIKYILLIDEIDAIPKEVMIEFVKTVRSIFIERISVAGFKSYTMLLCGSSDLASLTYGKTSPFNISKIIYLRDFSFEEIHNWLIPIFHSLEIYPDKVFVQKLFDQTQGHPYLTQMLCSKIVRKIQMEGRQQIIPDDFNEVDRIIDEGDINLLTILEKIKEDEFLQEMILMILKGDSIRYSRTHDIIHALELIGAICRKDGYCHIRNPIYQKFFTQYFTLKDHNLPLPKFTPKT